MIKCEYCHKTFPKRYLKLHTHFEHRTSVTCIKYTCNYKNCHRCYSKALLQHKKRYKHFKTTIFESDISKDVNINNDFTTKIL